MHDMQATRRMQAVSSRAGPEPGSVGRVTIKRASGIIFLGAMLPAHHQYAVPLLTSISIGMPTSRLTIRYDSGYLTCSKKLTGSQLSLPHGINRKLKCETKNKMMSVISPVRSRYHEAVQ